MRSDLLAIGAAQASKRAAIKDNTALSIMVAGFASDDVAKHAWSFSLIDKDSHVRHHVFCTGTNEFGATDLIWMRNGEGKVSRDAQSAFKNGSHHTFFNTPQPVPAVWTMVSKAIPMARAIREDGMTAKVVGGKLVLEGGSGPRAEAMRNAKSLSAFAQIARGRDNVPDCGKVRRPEMSGQAITAKPIAELEATDAASRATKMFQPLFQVANAIIKMASRETGASLASAQKSKIDDPVVASPSDIIPAPRYPVECAVKANSSSTPFARRVSSHYGYSVRLVEKINSADCSLIGVQLGLACIANDISVSEVARTFGVTRQTIYYWFLGRALPRDKKAALIRDFLGSELDLLPGNRITSLRAPIMTAGPEGAGHWKGA
jgi:hypothetical protein